jgi:hypothetical protein
VDGGQHAAPIGLPLLEGAGWFEPGELVGVGLGLDQPGGGGGAMVVKPLAPQSPPMARRSIRRAVGEGRLP